MMLFQPMSWLQGLAEAGCTLAADNGLGTNLALTGGRSSRFNAALTDPSRPPDASLEASLVCSHDAIALLCSDANILFKHQMK